MAQRTLQAPRNYYESPRRYGEEYTSAHSDEHGISFDPDEKRTLESEAAACDINNIMKRFEATGLLPNVNKTPPRYEDVSTAQDFQASMHIVAEANAMFMSFPASVRERFFNDPARFLAFCEDPANGDELLKLGLATAKPQKEEPTPASSPKPGSPKQSKLGAQKAQSKQQEPQDE